VAHRASPRPAHEPATHPAAATAAAALALFLLPPTTPAAFALMPPVMPPPPPPVTATATAAAMAWFGGGGGNAAPNAAASATAPPLLGAPVPRAERPPVSEIVSEEVANPPDLPDFLALHSSGRAAKMSSSALESARLKVGFSRAPTGRVSLLATGGAYGSDAAKRAERFEVRADMGAPGFLLLRDESGGCWYLPPDPSGDLAQIDLSDDAVVAQLFANHVWEDLIEPLDVAEGGGGGGGGAGGAGSDGQQGQAPQQLRQLRLSEGEFRAVLSLVRGATPLPAERLEGPRERR
jgi:hypothetical protein